MEDLFTNRRPNPQQEDALNAVTLQMLETYALLVALPQSRFRSLAMTKLEECSMWAKKAVVFTFAVETTDAEAVAPPVTDRLMGSGGVDPE